MEKEALCELISEEEEEEEPGEEVSTYSPPM
jgi:hypothetical protein